MTSGLSGFGDTVDFSWTGGAVGGIYRDSGQLTVTRVAPAPTLPRRTFRIALTAGGVSWLDDSTVSYPVRSRRLFGSVSAEALRAVRRRVGEWRPSVRDALGAGWEPRQIAAAAIADSPVDVRDWGGFTVSRLRGISAQPPPLPALVELAWCEHCESSGYRYREVDGGRWAPCFACSPQSARAVRERARAAAERELPTAVSVVEPVTSHRPPAGSEPSPEFRAARDAHRRRRGTPPPSEQRVAA